MVGEAGAGLLETHFGQLWETRAERGPGLEPLQPSGVDGTARG